MTQLNFDARTVAPATGFETIPAGWYKALIDESEMVPTKAGDGAYLKVRFVILDGPQQGRKLFVNLNLRNANPQAQEIAFKQLSAIAHAVNVMQVADSSQLHNLPMNIKVKVRKDDSGQYEDQNVITQWKNINEAVGATPAAPGGAPPAFTPPPTAPVPGTGWTAPPVAAPPAPPAAPPAAPVWNGPPGSSYAQYQAAGWTDKHMSDAGYLLAPPAPPAAVAAPPPPAAWTPPAGGSPWAAVPAAPGAAAPAAPTPPAPPHAAQSNLPPWQQPKQ